MMAAYLVSNLVNGSAKISLEDAKRRVVRGLETPVKEKLQDWDLLAPTDLAVCGISCVKNDGTVEGSMLGGFGKLTIDPVPVKKLWPEAPLTNRNMRVTFNLSLEDFEFPGDRADYGTSDWMDIIRSDNIFLMDGDDQLTPHAWASDHPALKGSVRVNIAPATADKVYVQVTHSQISLITFH